MRKYPIETIKEYVELSRIKNRKGWMERVKKELGKIYNINEVTICSCHHYSGEVRLYKNQIQIFSYGTQVKSRYNGFYYNLYPVLQLN